MSLVRKKLQSGVKELAEKKVILEMKGISKTFPGVKALSDVQLRINEGEVHALMGENGAGKSTLMKVLSGVFTSDEGDIYIDGKLVSIKNPHSAKQLGISIIHQELMLAENVPVYNNMFMGREIISNRLLNTLDNKAMIKKADEVLNGMINAGIDVKRIVSTLSVAQKQLVEIARAIMWNSRIIIMDEPTSSLSNKDIATLFNIIRQLSASGTSIIYISHRMEEINQICHKVTVLRDGNYVGTRDISEINMDELIKMMVGRNLQNKYPKERVQHGEVVLRVKNLTRAGIIDNISLDVRKGQILGIFGLIGAGRTELVKAIYGADPIDSGEIELNGKKLDIKSPNDAIKTGIGLIPEDRKLEGLVQIQSVGYNVTLPILRKMKKGFLVNTKKQKEVTQKYIDRLTIKTPSIKQIVRNLSGGNQQKVIIAKWLASQSEVLIFDEPTRGIDVGSKIEIYKIMNNLLKEGVAIIMISSELPELLSISDKIIVMKQGRGVAEFEECANLTKEEVLKCAF